MNTSLSSFRVLVIDDMPSIHDDFRKILEPAAARPQIAGLASAIFGATATTPTPTYALDSALQGQDGFALVGQALAKAQPYALAFVDMRIPPGWDGLETIARIRTVDPAIQIVICTAYSDHSWATITERIGASDNVLILKKPFDHVEVLQLAHTLCRKWQLARDNVAHLRSLDELVRHRTFQLAEAEARFSQAFSASPLAQAIIAWDPAEFIDANPAFEKQFKVDCSRLSSYRPNEVMPVEFSWMAFQEKIAKAEAIDDRPFTQKSSDGKERHLRYSARAVTISNRACAILVVRDVTEQVEAEQQLRQSQKLEAIGQLTAGIAHDFNNLLTVIHSYTSELLVDRPDPQTREMLEPVQTAAMQAASLVRQLLIFSRKEIVQPQTLDLCAVFDSLRALLRRLIGTDIAIEWAVPSQLPLVIADPANLEQIIVNLVVNARDAMRQGGQIRIEASPCLVDASTASRHPEAKPGHFIKIDVSDTGTGIPSDVLPRIFEPFFTTKEVGKGTGLGLATVYSIVKQHGGWIQVSTQLGTGTTFTIYQPVAPTPDVPAPAAPDTQIAKTNSPSHPQNVLVVEDDPAIQTMLSTLLTRRQIKHSLASDGVAALALWDSSLVPFDLLITDIVMPNGINGLSLARSIRQENPRLGVILMSGYSDAFSDPKNLQIPGEQPKFLDKPFTPNRLFAAIAAAYTSSVG